MKTIFFKKRVRSLFVLKVEYFFRIKRGWTSHRWGGFFSLEKARKEMRQRRKEMEKEEKVGVILTCVDSRLHQKEGGNLVGDLGQLLGFSSYFLQTFPGGVKFFSRSPRIINDFNRLFWESLKISISHGAEEVAILQHEDCKAYSLPNSWEEEERQNRDMSVAEYYISKKLVVPVSMFFARLNSQAKGGFELFEYLP